MLESVKEVVDSRVGNRVGTLIAYYSYDSLQINVKFVFLSPRNSVGGDIVTWPFVGGWVSE